MVSRIVRIRALLILLIPSLCRAPHVLVDSIRAYLSSEMKGAADSFGEENSKTKPFPRLTDGKAMINYYAKIACENVIRTFDDVDYPDSKCPPDFLCLC